MLNILSHFLLILSFGLPSYFLNLPLFTPIVMYLLLILNTPPPQPPPPYWVRHLKGGQTLHSPSWAYLQSGLKSNPGLKLGNPHLLCPFPSSFTQSIPGILKSPTINTLPSPHALLHSSYTPPSSSSFTPRVREKHSTSILMFLQSQISSHTESSTFIPSFTSPLSLDAMLSFT